MAEAKVSAASIYTSLTERLEQLETLMQRHRKLAQGAKDDKARARHQANLASAEGRVAKIQAEAHAKLAELEQERAAIRNSMGTSEDYADVERGILAIKDILARHNKTAPMFDAYAGDPNDRSKGAKFT